MVWSHDIWCNSGGLYLITQVGHSSTVPRRGGGGGGVYLNWSEPTRLSEKDSEELIGKVLLSTQNEAKMKLIRKSQL